MANLHCCNPNVLLGATVAGPDQYDNFQDQRAKPWFTEPTVANNAGLVAALIALHDPPRTSESLLNSSDLSSRNKFGIDYMGIFGNIHY